MSAPVPTLERLLQILIEELDATRDEVSDDTLFVDDLGADSLDVVGVIVRAEQEFGLVFSDAEIEAVDSVGQLVALIDRLRATPAEGGAS